jgi:hypothetical protein
LLSLIVAIVFLVLPSRGIFVPAMGIAFFCGIALATLAYTFLGGKGSDKVELRGIQLTGAVAVVVALILLTNGPLERQIGILDLLQKETLKAANADNRAKAAEEASHRELIVERGSSMDVVSGGQIQLDDVNTLNGWGEGPHSENKQRANAPDIFERLFRRLDIQHSPADVLGMDESQWHSFLAGLPEGKRLQLGGIPFARIKLRSSDGRAEEAVVFKKDVVPLLNKKSQPEAFLCIRRIMDVRERRSDEPEIIVLTHSRQRCQ